MPGGRMENLKIFLLGIIAAVGLLFVSKAVSIGSPGRYQAIPVVEGGAGLFIVDTQTGITKIVWGKWRGGQLGKSFSEMTSDPGTK